MKFSTKVLLALVLALVVSSVLFVTTSVLACTEGCTPGFWKQEQHFIYWPHQLCTQETWAFLKGPCDPAQLVDLSSEPWNFLVQDVPGLIPACMITDGIFDLNGDGAADTLLDALNYQGGEDSIGKAQILLRAAVAGLLNGMTMDHFAPWQIIFIVNGSLDKDDSLAGCQLRLPGIEYWSNQFDIQNERGCVFSP